MKFSELTTHYVRCFKRYEKRRARLEQELEKAKAKLDALTYPHWIDKIVKPIAKALEEAMPDRRAEILGPFGLCAHTSIHLHRRGVPKKQRFGHDNCLSITFVPGDLDTGKIYVKDYTQNTNRYRPDTIGEMNDMNYPDLPIPQDAGVEWFIAWMKRAKEKR